MKRSKKIVLAVVLTVVIVLTAVGIGGYLYYADSRDNAHTIELEIKKGTIQIKEGSLSYTVTNNCYAPVMMREVIVCSLYDAQGKPVEAKGSAYSASQITLEGWQQKAVQDHQIIYIYEYTLDRGKVPFDAFLNGEMETTPEREVLHSIQSDYDGQFHIEVILQGRIQETDAWKTLDGYSTENKAPQMPLLTHAVSYEWKVKEGKAYLTGIGTISDTDIYLPAEIALVQQGEEYVYDPVMGTPYAVVVGSESFCGTEIKTVYFQDDIMIEGNTMGSLFLVGKGMFEDCKQLKEVRNIPQSVTAMPKTFRNCTALEITPQIPATVTNLQECFSGCSTLKMVSNLPETTLNLSGCFRNCSMLESVSVMPLCAEDLSACFSGCTALKETPHLPETAKNLNKCFQGCVALVRAGNLPNSVQNMDDCFAGCSSLIKVENIPNSVETMNQCFMDCKELKRIPVLPDRRVAYNRCFKGCEALEGTIEIPMGATDLLYAKPQIENMFQGCEKLEGIIVNCCKEAAYIEDLPQTLPVTYAIAHSSQGTCPGCRYTSGDYTVDGLAVRMDKVPEVYVPILLDLLDNEVPAILKDKCSKMVFSTKQEEYYRKLNRRDWAGIAFHPTGYVVVLVPEAIYEELNIVSEEQRAEVNRKKPVKKSTIYHELGHCYDFQYSNTAIHSDSAAWRKLYNKEWQAFRSHLFSGLYTKEDYREETFAEATDWYFNDPDRLKKECPGMYAYIDNLFCGAPA